MTAGEDDDDMAKSRPARGKAPMAVALSYDADSGDAPTVVASGRGAVAEQILQIAFANGVRVREDPDLAELLSAITIDSEIPIEAFAAVAEILAYVYRANNQAPPMPGTPDKPETGTASP